MRKRIEQIAREQVGTAGPYGGNPYEWCGMFVCWVLWNAGLHFEVKGKPGASLCSQLTRIERPQVGDVMCFAPTPHYGIVVHVGSNLIETVDGGAEGQFVKLKARKPEGRHYYSIEPLLERFEFTGAPTRGLDHAELFPLMQPVRDINVSMHAMVPGNLWDRVYGVGVGRTQ